LRNEREGEVRGERKEERGMELTMGVFSLLVPAGGSRIGD
jgi:hypothetical protein